MKRKCSRLLSGLLAAVLVLGLTGCGNTQTGSTPEEKAAAKNYVYRMQEIESDLINDNTNVGQLTYLNGRIYFISSEYFWEEQEGRVISLISMKEDGSDGKSVELVNTLRDNPDYNTEGVDEPADAVPLENTATAVLEDTAAATIEPRTATVTEEAEEETATDVQVDSYLSDGRIAESGVYFLLETSSYRFDADGNYQDLGSTLELCAYELDGTPRYRTVLSEDQNEKYMYFDSMLPTEDGKVLLLCSNENSLITVDEKGSISDRKELMTDGWSYSVFLDQEGRLCIISMNDAYTEMTLKKYNPSTGAEESSEKLPDFLNNYGLNSGKSYDLVLTNSMGMYGYNFGDEEVTPIFNYINSDISPDMMGNLVEAEEGKLLATYYDQENYNTRIAVLNHVDPSEIPDKEVLTLACYYLDYNMRKRVISFNKESEKYRITVKDYSSYATMEDYSAGYDRLSSDILAGQVPDILVLENGEMPVESFIAKGLFADIGKLIEEDEELDMEDYLTNVFDAYKVDGKLYSVIPSFYIATVLGKTSMVGDTPGWTMADLQKLMAEYPESSAFGQLLSRSDMLSYAMMFQGSHFVDGTNGTCSFDTQEFEQLLAFIAQFPESTEVDDDYWMDYDTQWRDGRTLLMTTTISNFTSYNEYQKAYFGEPITPIGFPTDEGNGAVAMADAQYAISAKSKNKEGAWEFLRYYLTEEYQTSDELSWRLPVLKSAVETMMEEAQERPYWEDEDGNKQYYDNTWYLNNEEILIEPMTKEEAQSLYEYILSVNKAYYADEALCEIIEEEAAAYYAGQKTAAEVAEIIQSRAKIYISESR